MSVQVIDNFSYKGKKGNFERDNFDTLQAMRSYPEDGIDDGHVCFCNEDGNHYKFNHLNSVDGATGRWRLHNKSVNTLTETGEGKVLDARQGKILKDLIDAKVIEAGGVSFDTVPTKGSTNPVTSNGIKEAMDEQAESINSNMGVDDYPVFSTSEAYPKGKVVNYNGKLYKFTADHAAGAWIGTDVEPYNLKKDIEERYGTYTDSPEFIRAYTDAEGKFLWGIRIDGSIEWAKGVPTPIQNALKELADKIKNLGGDKIEKIETTLNEKIEALQDAIDVINASLKPLTDTFSYQDSPEFVSVVTDNENKVLFGIKEDGKPYFPKNEMYHVESNQEFLAAWLDAAGHVLFGLRTDGSTYVAKADFMDKIAKIEQMLKDGGFDDSEVKEQVTALQENVDTLSSDVKAVKEQVGTLGTDVESVKSEYEEIKPSIDFISGTFSIISNDEWMHAVVDAGNKLLFGIKAETGEIVMPKQDTYKIISNEEWMAVWVDASNKPLFGVKADGTFWCAKSNFSVPDDYVKQEDFENKTAALDEQIEGINTTLSTMQGVLSSLQKTVSQNTNDITFLQETVSGLQQGNEAMQMMSVIDDAEERLSVVTDNEEKVLSYRDKDGILHENKGFDTPKYYQDGKEKDFVDKSEVADEVTKATENGAVKLENVEGVSNHNTPNLLIAAEMQKTFNDGTNSFTPPNEGYEMSNPIECQAGDWFTRTGTATGMVVVTDENDKNGARLFNADGTTLGNTFQIPENMTWVRYIRMAAEVGGANDGSIVICKGKEAFVGANRGDFLTVNKLRVEKRNLSKDVMYIKSEDGTKFYELYVDSTGVLKAREVDPDIIPENEYPTTWIPFTLTGSFEGYFDRICIQNNRCLIELKAAGSTKIKSIGYSPNSTYGNFEHFYTNSGEDRYVMAFALADNSTLTAGKRLTIYDGSFNIIAQNISAGDIHDFVYIDDNHNIILGTSSASILVPGDTEKRNITGIYAAEYKKIDGIWIKVGEFNAVDYPQLCTDAFGNTGGTISDCINGPHVNTVGLDYDGNLILNSRDWDNWIKVRRVENPDGTVTLGSKTLDYDEAIIGRVGGRHNSGYLDSKRVLNDGFGFTDIPVSLTEVSDDTWEEWQWFHCHDVKYWGMKTIEGEQYPTYTLFDNNYWTDGTMFNIVNRNNNDSINPQGAGSSYLVSKDNDENYAKYQHSRVIQLSIDWDNHKIMDYRVYYIPKKYSKEQGGATMYDEGIISIAYSYAGEFGLWDFTTEETEVSGHVYKGAKQLFFGKYENYIYCYRANTYKLKS